MVEREELKQDRKKERGGVDVVECSLNLVGGKQMCRSKKLIKSQL